MLVDKLPWCNHDGHPIFSVNVQAGGSRFATGGSDGKAKIWSLACALDADTEIKASPPLLSTLTEHNGPVNVVRFSNKGTMLATGSDDHLACVFELRPGPATSTLGASTPNLENWRVKAALRGHANNVVDLAWSPDDSLLATASLDGTAAVWRPGAGAGAGPLRRLTAHTSFVKGVAFDPVGSYLATASDDRSVIVWKVEDWSVVARVSAPFSMMISSTFALRCSWSPDGQWLLAGNSFQGATHAAVLLPRERWAQPKECLFISGHSGAVICGSFNPRLFSAPQPSPENDAAAANGGSPPPADEGLTSVFAIGSQDRRATVWTAGADRPIFCASHFFSGQILDVAWATSGYGLLCCSSDGTVASFQFAVEELGQAAPSAEVQKLLRALYGRSGPQSQQKRRLVESVEQLELEDDGLVRPASGQAIRAALEVAGGLPASTRAPPQTEATPAGAVGDVQVPGAVAAAPPSAAAALHARLGGEAASTGFVQESGVTTQQPKRRVTAVQSAAPQEKTPAPAAAMDAGAAVPQLKAWSLPVPPPQREITLTLAGPEGLDSVTARIVNAGPGRGAALTVGGAPDRPVARWSDSLPRPATAAVAAGRVLVVGLDDSSLAIYTPHGRRAVSLLRLGGGAVVRLVAAWPFVAALTASGDLRVWEWVCAETDPPTAWMRASLAPLLDAAGVAGPTLAHLGLAAGGRPVATLSDGSSHVWASGLEAWMLVADAGLAQSAHRPGAPGADAPGAVAGLQRRALALAEAGPGRAARLLAAGRERGAEATRAHLESSLAAARELGDAAEFRHWLLKYVAALTAAREEGRLQETCGALLAARREEGPRDPEDFPLTVAESRRLLRDEVLPIVARERALQRLTQRFRDALDDVLEFDA
ncbi:hypothetical protein QBZ16_004410 [Prototheca wickerhamii]|uniref:Protein HIRA n=1 Tax=Prototheca wickerhamii TaxID=3111 RepID=A0AAD9MK65_PROWI|nr:hypothetical protein QBZ16_004410 [Prototheca wickerhamii]